MDEIDNFYEDAEDLNEARSRTPNPNFRPISRSGRESNIEKMFNSNGNEDIIIVTHGNLLGIILKFYFKRNFGFNDWKIMSMPDLYELSIENNNIISFNRNIENINKLFYIK